MRRFFPFFAVLLLCCLLLSGTAGAVFSDVPSGSWYETAVTQMAADGLLSGYPDGAFRPQQTISAAEFVSIAARCGGLTPAQSSTVHWASGWTQAALTAGWYDWDELPPTGERFDQPISRQLAVKITMRALLPDAHGDYLTESQKITDFAQLDGRYYDPVLAAYASGVVSGDAAGCFRPAGSLSRAEACILLHAALQKSELPHPVLQPAEPAQPLPLPAAAISSGVSQNGWLRVIGTQLCSESGIPIILRGMSTHGLQWYGNFANAQSIRNLADAGANLFRIAMYTGENGYLSQPEAIRQQACAAIDAAIANDLYVILDWHILSDGNPMQHVREAEAFFSDLAQRYRDCPAVLYEICNEPNGSVTWARDIRPYAETIIAAIRQHAPKAIVLVGSSTWSQDLHIAAESPLPSANLLYTLHFYSGTHGAELRNRIDAALQKGLPVFVSEWGTSRADGSGGVFLEEAKQWLDFLEARGISWANWSLCDKAETSAALRPGTPNNRAWTESDLTESGKFVFSRFRGTS